jgi:hypothetical protein
MLVALISNRVFHEFCTEHFILWLSFGGVGFILLIFSFFIKKKGDEIN